MITFLSVSGFLLMLFLCLAALVAQLVKKLPEMQKT